MIAMMSVSFFFIGLIVLMVAMFFVGIAALVAVVTKRPGIVAIVGLAILLLFGGGLISLIGVRSVSHSNVHAPPGVNVYPEVHHDYTIAHSESHDQLPMPQVEDGTILIPPIMDASGKAWTDMPTISTPSGGFSSSGTHIRTKIAMFPLLLVCGAVVAIVVAAISRRKSNSTASGRGSWWPALLLVPLAGLLLLSVVGILMAIGLPTYSRVRSHASARDEALNHQFAQQQLEIAHTQMARAEELHADQIRAQASQRVEALNAQLQRQFANMDINQLIAIFESPKIELSSTTQSPAPPAPPAAVEAQAIRAAPVVTAPIVTVSEGKPSEVVEVDKPQDKPAEVAIDQGKKASGKKRNKPKVDNSNAAVEVSAPIKKSEPLPDWVDDQPGMFGDDWREVVATDEYATAEECRRATDIYLMLKTAERLQTLAGHSYIDHTRPSLAFHQGRITADGTVIFDSQNPTYWYDDRLSLLRRMGIGIDEIRRSVVREQHLASRDSPRALNTMHKQYTYAQFTPWFDGQLRRHWDTYRRHERFAVVGVGASSVLGLLGFVFGLLKIDTWTKGYYTKRLFIGVPAAIIGGFAFFMLIAILFE